MSEDKIVAYAITSATGESLKCSVRRPISMDGPDPVEAWSDEPRQAWERKMKLRLERSKWRSR